MFVENMNVCIHTGVEGNKLLGFIKGDLDQANKKEK
jgi:hypothetical protein